MIALRVVMQVVCAVRLPLLLGPIRHYTQLVTSTVSSSLDLILHLGYLGVDGVIISLSFVSIRLQHAFAILLFVKRLRFCSPITVLRPSTKTSVRSGEWRDEKLHSGKTLSFILISPCLNKHHHALSLSGFGHASPHTEAASGP